MTNTLGIYFPDDKKDLRKGLERLAKQKDRSVNYLILKAIEAYPEKEKE